VEADGGTSPEMFTRASQFLRGDTRIKSGYDRRLSSK
jgi:hypothetical protein